MGLEKPKKLAKTRVSASNQLTEVFNKLEAQGCDPITELAKIAMDVDRTPLKDRINILMELAQYTAAKRRAVDFGVDTGDDGIFKIEIVKFSKDLVGQAQGMMRPEIVSNIKNGGEIIDVEEYKEEKETAAG